MHGELVVVHLANNPTPTYLNATMESDHVSVTSLKPSISQSRTLPMQARVHKRNFLELMVLGPQLLLFVKLKSPACIDNTCPPLKPKKERESTRIVERRVAGVTNH